MFKSKYARRQLYHEKVAKMHQVNYTILFSEEYKAHG